MTIKQSRTIKKALEYAIMWAKESAELHFSHNPDLSAKYTKDLKDLQELYDELCGT